MDTGPLFALSLGPYLVESSLGCLLAITVAVLFVIWRRMCEADTAEAKLRGILESAPDGIVIVDGAGKIVLASARVGAIFGYDPGELVGQPFDQLVSGPGPAAAEPTSGIRQLSLEGRRKDGTRIPVEVYLRPGCAAGACLLVGVIRDLRARRRKEETLRLRDRAMEAIAQGIFITDAGQPGNPVVYVNPACERLTSRSQSQALGRPWTGLLPEGAAVLDEAEAHMAAGCSCLVELRGKRPEGGSVWQTLALDPVRDDAGKVTHFVGVLTDVSDHKRLEGQLLQAQKMEAVGRLAGGIAHDFNNLLTVINGYSGLLLQATHASDSAHTFAEEVARAGERAAALTAQLLAFSRKQVLSPVVVNLNALIADLSKLLRRLIGEDVELKAHLGPDLHRVKVDPGQLGQALMNLVVNARDAIPRGGTVTIRTANTDVDETTARSQPGLRPGPYVTLTVSDTGCGMSEAVKAHLFEPFFTTKEQGKGTGLGLACVYGVVKQSGGYIQVESAAGRGTTFTIYLPQAEESVSRLQRRPPVPLIAGGGGTVLLVEDEEPVRAMAGHVLRQAGYTVLEAHDGEAALAVSHGHAGRIHLLLTDVVMPHLGGGELAQQLARARPGLAVLFMSGYADDRVVRQGVSQATAVFLTKPFTPETLLEKVREVLGRATSRAPAADVSVPALVGASSPA
jgi:PAS domain S-box-containing protein